MKAAIAACCAGTGGQSAKLPASASKAAHRSDGTRAQPSRQPVIPQYLENDDTTTASRSWDQAQAPSESPAVIPW